MEESEIKSEKILPDREEILNKVKQNGKLLDTIPEEFKDDREIVLDRKSVV